MNSPHASRITHHASRFWLPLAAAAVLLLAAPPVPAGIPMPMFVIYGTIRDALNWRNIKVYYLSAYAASTGPQTNLNPYTGQRYLWDPVYVDNTTGRPVALLASFLMKRAGKA